MTGQERDILTPQGKRIEAFERETGLSLNRLAKNAGLTRETLSRIKNGRSDGEDESFVKLASALSEQLGRKVSPSDVRVSKEAAPEPGSPYDRLQSLEGEVRFLYEQMTVAFQALGLELPQRDWQLRQRALGGAP